MRETAAMTLPPITIAHATTSDDVAVVRALFTEYIAGLGIDLSFQDVEAELADLPGKYAPPTGAILLARDSAGLPVGCVALRPSAASGACEIKRLYVRPEARGHDLGRRLATEILSFAQEVGYKRVMLDTLAPMQTAQALYTSLGFQSTAAYYDNPMPGTIYMARDL
jgi:putative acetyltransferase